MKRTQANSSPVQSDEIQRRGALVLQTLPILLIPLFVAIITFLLLRLSIGDQFAPRPEPSGPPGGPLIPIVVLVVFFSALIILVRLGRPTISALLLIGAWTLVMALGALRSGVTSFTPALLIIPICAAGLLIDWVACVSLAGLATLLVASLAWLETHGLLPPSPPPPPFVAGFEPYLAVGFWVAIFATVAALTSLLAGGLQRALQQSRAQAETLQELSGQLEARVEAQTTQILEQERQAATLAERARLAREIHDTLAQGLTSIVVQLGAAQRAQAADSDATAQHIELAQRMAREALAEARRSVWNLRAPALERGSLADALRSIVARPIRPDQSATFEQRGEPWPLPQEAEAALLRMAQEALANVAKHAEATRVEVLLEYTPDSVRLSIADNGVGFEQSALSDGMMPSPAGGFGLLGIRERIGALGGTLELRNGDGAQVAVTIPKIEN
ncbi:MAG TPA: sensor histidine kinase [Roseiflexaceae bacterium]|nr:sensor histidine kinase [Roseiflexaceae bacterium]